MSAWLSSSLVVFAVSAARRARITGRSSIANTRPMSADIPAIPLKPSAAAITAMMKKTTA